MLRFRFEIVIDGYIPLHGIANAGQLVSLKNSSVGLILTENSLQKSNN